MHEGALPSEWLFPTRTLAFADYAKLPRGAGGTARSGSTAAALRRMGIAPSSSSEGASTKAALRRMGIASTVTRPASKAAGSASRARSRSAVPARS
eukprot:1636434-Alexandrium_andersonii.AAC.1